MTAPTATLSDRLEELARSIEACCEDAKRPEPVPGYDNVFRNVDPRTISLANGLLHVASALRALATLQGGEG